MWFRSPAGEHLLDGVRGGDCGPGCGEALQTGLPKQYAGEGMLLFAEHGPALNSWFSKKLKEMCNVLVASRELDASVLSSL